jgi:hypothetical protein
MNGHRSMQSNERCRSRMWMLQNQYWEKPRASSAALIRAIQRRTASSSCRRFRTDARWLRRGRTAKRIGFRIELLQQWRIFTNRPSCNSAPQRPDDGKLSPLRIRSKTHRAPTVPSSPSEFGRWPDDMRGSFLCGSVPPVDREKQRPSFEYIGEKKEDEPLLHLSPLNERDCQTSYDSRWETSAKATRAPNQFEGQVHKFPREGRDSSARIIGSIMPTSLPQSAISVKMSRFMSLPQSIIFIRISILQDIRK